MLSSCSPSFLMIAHSVRVCMSSFPLLSHFERYTTNPNIAVVLLGYPFEMAKMMRDQNPGFRGRFDWERRFIFEDYTKDELDAIVFGIVDGKDGVTMSRAVRRKLSGRLEAMRESVPNFRNAAEAKSIIDKVMARARARQKREQIEGTDVVITMADLTSTEEAELLSEGPLAPLKSLMRMGYVQEKLEVRSPLSLTCSLLLSRSLACGTHTWYAPPHPSPPFSPTASVSSTRSRTRSPGTASNSARMSFQETLGRVKLSLQRCLPACSTPSKTRAGSRCCRRRTA